MQGPKERTETARIFDLAKPAIESMTARKILDSRGKWTIEVEVNSARASAPAGASVGIHEAKTVPAERAVELVNSKLQELVSMELNQLVLDARLRQIDGTGDFSKIGGNTAIAVSLAVYRALNPIPKGNTFPFPLVNVFGGGKHGGKTDIQEFLVCPVKAKTILQAMESALGAYHTLKERLAKKVDLVGMNDEGAAVANLPMEKVFDLLKEIAKEFKLRLGLDVAASTFYNKKRQLYVHKNLGKTLSSGEQIDFISRLIKDHKLFYVEDPLHEEDFVGFQTLTKKFGRKCLIVGDDLTVTNPDRLQEAIKKKSISGIIIKPNQIGTISLAKDTVETAKKARIVPVISHRSGETGDVTISYLALDWQIPIIKAGISDLTTKLNALVRFWEDAQKKNLRPKMARLRV